MSLWLSDDTLKWQHTLAQYGAAVATRPASSMVEHDQWYHEELPAAIFARGADRYITLEELARLTKWKMERGTWRARNLALVLENSARDVETISRAAFAEIPHPSRPISRLASLRGVGPATASAVVAAAAPEHYPFFDEDVGAQVIPSLGAVKFTMGYYAVYAAALIGRAQQLGGRWTPSLVERALWAHAILGTTDASPDTHGA